MLARQPQYPGVIVPIVDQHKYVKRGEVGKPSEYTQIGVVPCTFRVRGIVNTLDRRSRGGGAAVRAGAQGT